MEDNIQTHAGPETALHCTLLNLRNQFITQVLDAVPPLYCSRFQ